ncbi:unnamed protein product [Auanema sp. JU1783]|nr:unnamed protein product [Auanema sp. JU1783]
METPETGPFKAFVGNLPFDCTHGDIEHILRSGCQFSDEELSKCEIRLVRDKETDQFRGFGYVEVASAQQLQALLGLDGIEYGNRSLRIDLATTKARTGGPGGRGGRGGGRDGGREGGRDGGREGGRDLGRDGQGGHRDFGGHGGSRGGGSRGGGRGGNGGFQVVGRGGRVQTGRQEGRRRNSHRDEVISDDPNIEAERPRLVLKPPSTDPAELEAKKKREAEEEAARRAKLFQA